MQVGDAEECAPGAWVADAAGEEAALAAATRLLPTLPHHGDQPQGKQGGSLWGKCVHIVGPVSEPVGMVTRLQPQDDCCRLEISRTCPSKMKADITEAPLSLRCP